MAQQRSELIDSTSYSRDADAMEKFVQDSTLLTQIHDMDMVFELLTNIAKQTTDEALTAIQQTDRKEVYRPWNAMLKDTSEVTFCFVLPVTVLSFVIFPRNMHTTSIFFSFICCFPLIHYPSKERIH